MVLSRSNITNFSSLIYKLNTTRYRKNVGLIIINDQGKVLLCRRKKSNSWQFPQGGIDKDETPKRAAYRELYEEVNIKRNEIKFISSTNFWATYELPDEYKKNLRGFLGQKQKWYLFKLYKDADIHFNNDDDQEFDKYEWVSFWYPLKKIIFFKKDVYKKVLRFFSTYYSELNVN